MTIKFTAIVAATSLAVLAGVANGAARRTHGPAKRNEPVYRAVEASREGALELLKTIVGVDSGSGDIPGGERVESILAERLKAAGAEVRSAPAEVANVAPNLVAVFHGTGKAKVLIIAHVDTVYGPGTVAQRPIRVEGDCMYGPGVGDEKGGV